MTSQDLTTVKQRFGIIGQNSQLNRAIEVAVQVAPTEMSVLVTGESGVGKEFFPQIIHAFSNRKHGPYFAVNCGAIPEGTIDSELFGHEKGAFTDAKAERKGYFEIANGGTLFLDEVGELPIATQAKLLRVLEKGEFIRMGASTVQKTNVRVVAATNVNMQEAIREGRFREDLYYRLNTVEIKVPALRERKEDIPMLFRKFAMDISDKYRMPAIRLNEEATNLLQSYYWNGNIRQLKNVAEQISVIEKNHDITAETLRKYLPENEFAHSLAIGKRNTESRQENFMNEREILYKVLFDMKRDMSKMQQQLDRLMTGERTATVLDDNIRTSFNNVPTAVHTTKHSYDDAEEAAVYAEEVNSMDEMEKEHIRHALEKTEGNRRDAAKLLNISERTLYRKIKEYEL